MSRVLIIGAGGVGRVVAHKCARLPRVFSEICLASRGEEKCKAIARELKRPIRTACVNADRVPDLVALMRDFRPAMVINVALPYQDLSIMDACLRAGAHYLDTANFEPPNEARFCYKWQWAYHDRFRKAGLMAVLGSGFDPGVSSVFTTHALKHHFDRIETIDILDCNAGEHGLPFATNFNPEINIREITARGKYYERGKWKETEPFAISKLYDFPEGIGKRRIYLLYHEELESLARHIPGVKAIRFWMTFSERYLAHLRVLESVGMTRIDPVMFKGRPIVPLQFLKAVLPDPGSLAAHTKGRTCIGCLIKGRKQRVSRRYFVYNICDHEACYRECNSQAVSYTTGVPAMIGAKMVLTGAWKGAGVYNMEQLDPDPFMADLSRYGLPWTETFPS